MTYELLSDRNLTVGLEVPIQYANDITGGWFFRIFLICLFGSIWVASSMQQVRRKGDVNLFATASASGLICIIFMTLISITTGIVTTLDFAFALVLEFAFVLIFFLTERSPY